jgi:hypothetical protein
MASSKFVQQLPRSGKRDRVQFAQLSKRATHAFHKLERLRSSLPDSIQHVSAGLLHCRPESVYSAQRAVHSWVIYISAL